MQTKALMGLIVGALLMVACASEPGTGAPVPAGPAPAHGGGLPAPVQAGVAVTITSAQAGQTVTVPVGTPFAVALVGIPTAGYVWEVTSIPAFLAQTGSGGGPTTQAQTQPGFVGGNHWEVTYFTASAAGEGELVLAQSRPWETNTPPNNTFRVRIHAQ